MFNSSSDAVWNEEKLYNVQREEEEEEEDAVQEETVGQGAVCF